MSLSKRLACYDSSFSQSVELGPDKRHRLTRSLEPVAFCDLCVCVYFGAASSAASCQLACGVYIENFLAYHQADESLTRVDKRGSVGVRGGASTLSILNMANLRAV